MTVKQKKYPHSVNYKQVRKCSKNVPLLAHSCSLSIPVSFLLTLANALLESALLSTFRVNQAQLLCLDQQPVFGINSQRT
jgi:hypothetical protein